MQKTANWHRCSWCRNRSMAKTLLVMKLTFLLLTAACFNVYAIGVSQTVTISGKDIPLKKVFTEVKKQTGFVFVFNVDLLKESKPVTLSVFDMPLVDFLSVSFLDQPFNYRIVDKTIFLSRKKTSSVPPAVSKRTPVEALILAITGRLQHANSKEPLAGASISVLGSQNAVVSDNNGHFSINANIGQTLIISYVGFESKRVVISSPDMGIISLSPDVQSLDETVVIAYGTTTKRLATGNIASIKAEEIEKQPINNPVLALQGRVPGVFIEQATGLPGSGVKVRIQGQNSIGNGNDPLYIVDGVPYTSQLLPSVNLTGLLGNSGSGDRLGNPFSFLNPADIESIEILKDADATAIYGSRAANGAILITTKKGKEGETRISLNLQNGWGKVTRKMDLLSSQQYLQMRHEGQKNDGISPGTGDYDLNGTWDTTRYTDWQKELIGGTSKYTDLQASISGGNHLTQFLIGGGYHRETTVFPGNFSDQRGSAHFSITNTSKNHKFRTVLTGNYLFDNNQLPNIDLTASALKLAPVAPHLYNENGSINWMLNQSGAATFTNPISYTLNKYKNQTSNLISNLEFGYKITNELSIKASLGYTTLQTDETTTQPLSAIRPQTRPFVQRTAQYGTNKITSYNIEPQVTYNRTFGKGNLDVLIGTTILETNSTSDQLVGTGYNSDFVLPDKQAASVISVTSTINTQYKYNALFARINYNYASKYIINLTARRDGSSRFGAENQFNNFGAAGAAWIFSEENLFKKNKSLLSFGKLRASYGSTGNDQIPDYYYLSFYSPISIIGTPYQGITAIQPDRLTNSYLQWEETKKLQVGADIGLINDRILLTTTYFHNRSSNQLLPYILPQIVGFDQIQANFPAKVQNSGWEFSLNTENVKTKNITWSTSLNLTVPHTKLISFRDLETSSYANSLIIGQPINILRLFKSSGVDPQTGLYQFQDAQGKLTSSPIDPVDRIAVVKLDPSFYGGLSNSVTLKNFQIDFLFQFVKQSGNTYEYGSTPQGNFNAGYGNQPAQVFNNWKSPGNIVQFQKSSPRSPAVVNAYQNLVYSSNAAFSDASYIRLKNVSLSYILPQVLLQKMRIKNLRLYIQGQNILTITNYVGLDPENKSSSSLPPLRVVTLGLNATI